MVLITPIVTNFDPGDSQTHTLLTIIDPPSLSLPFFLPLPLFVSHANPQK